MRWSLRQPNRHILHFILMSLFLLWPIQKSVYIGDDRYPCIRRKYPVWYPCISVKYRFWYFCIIKSTAPNTEVSEELEPVNWNVVSSAKRMETNLEAFGRSLMKNRKRSGPRQLPCGTPHLHSRRQELNDSPLRLRLTY